MPADHRILIEQRGRSGTVRYEEPGAGAHQFAWEFGGGRTRFIIYIPAPDAWAKTMPWAMDRREEVVERIGREFSRQAQIEYRPLLSHTMLELRDQTSSAAP